MRPNAVWLGLATLLGCAVAGAAKAPEAPGPGNLTVHEWGTFLAMQGSDGVTLDGMYHEEHALPSFVHARSREQLRPRIADLKGETPVIYFYTPRRQPVHVEVRFPRGAWTQWYPQAEHVGPALVASGSPESLHDGNLGWDAEIDPDPALAAHLPATPAGALWRYAREVDAAFVKTTNETSIGTRSEYERFLFYRGLGRAPLPLRVSSTEDHRLRLEAETGTALRHVFILRVQGGKGAYRYVSDLPAGSSITEAVPSLTGAVPLAEFRRQVGDDLAGRLVEAGLYAKEARAMVNTWSASYFASEGVRVLFVLPQTWTDAFLPMRLQPQPDALVRVMVGRVEVLTPEREKRAEQAVRDLGAPDAARLEGAFAFLRDQGRYAEPVLRRVLASTADEQVGSLCRRLLTTDFITEVRAALNDPVTGAPRPARPSSSGRGGDDRVFQRAQLASLLREAGLDSEARKEAEAALAGLKLVAHPPDTQPGARHYLRAYARATEGAGDDRAAMEAYARFVRFGSQAKQCGGCHAAEGPRTMAWFRDWWAGRKYAEYATRAGLADQELHAHEAALDHRPTDTGERMLLAYLYAAKQPARAEEMWAAINGAAGRTARAER